MIAQSASHTATTLLPRPSSAYVSETPDQKNPSKLSPPPLKQNRLPRLLAAPLLDDMDCEDDNIDQEMSLITIMYGRNFTTPGKFSHVSSLCMPSLARADAIANRRAVQMANQMADDEVSEISSIARGHHVRPPAQERAAAAAAAGRAMVESAPDSPASESWRPLFPSDDVFTSSSVDRKRYAVLPKIKLFEE